MRVLILIKKSRSTWRKMELCQDRIPTLTHRTVWGNWSENVGIVPDKNRRQQSQETNETFHFWSLDKQKNKGMLQQQFGRQCKSSRHLLLWMNSWSSNILITFRSFFVLTQSQTSFLCDDAQRCIGAVNTWILDSYHKVRRTAAEIKDYDWMKICISKCRFLSLCGMSIKVFLLNKNVTAAEK